MDRYVFLNNQYYALLLQMRAHRSEAFRQLRETGDITKSIAHSIHNAEHKIDRIQLELFNRENAFADNFPNELMNRMLYDGLTVNI